jgi:hypothetical protein
MRLIPNPSKPMFAHSVGVMLECPNGSMLIQKHVTAIQRQHTQLAGRAPTNVPPNGCSRIQLSQQELCPGSHLQDFIRIVRRGWNARHGNKASGSSHAHPEHRTFIIHTHAAQVKLELLVRNEVPDLVLRAFLKGYTIEIHRG